MPPLTCRFVYVCVCVFVCVRVGFVPVAWHATLDIQVCICVCVFVCVRVGFMPVAWHATLDMQVCICVCSYMHVLILCPWLGMPPLTCRYVCVCMCVSVCAMLCVCVYVFSAVRVKKGTQRSRLTMHASGVRSARGQCTAARQACELRVCASWE